MNTETWARFRELEKRYKRRAIADRLVDQGLLDHPDEPFTVTVPVPGTGEAPEVHH